MTSSLESPDSPIRLGLPNEACPLRLAVPGANPQLTSGSWVETSLLHQIGHSKWAEIKQVLGMTRALETEDRSPS